jgi:hypothetical protein
VKIREEPKKNKENIYFFYIAFITTNEAQSAKNSLPRAIQIEERNAQN